MTPERVVTFGMPLFSEAARTGLHAVARVRISRETPRPALGDDRGPPWEECPTAIPVELVTVEMIGAVFGGGVYMLHGLSADGWLTERSRVRVAGVSLPLHEAPRRLAARLRRDDKRQAYAGGGASS